MARTTKRGKTGKKVAKKAAKKRAGSRTTKPAKTTAGAFSTTRARMAAMAAVPDTGPVTLEEARALAHVSQPAMAARAVRKEVAPPISPAAIGAEREKLKAEQRTERARRISEYRATMMVMKRRGARGPRAAAFDAAGGPPAAAADGSFDPLQILAEGELLVRLSGSVFRRRHHSAARASARRSHSESSEGGRRGALHARR